MIEPPTPPFLYAPPSARWDLLNSPLQAVSLSQSSGNTSVSPNNNIITPDTVRQKASGTAMSSVLPFSSRVNATMLTSRDAQTMNGFFRSGLPLTDPPITTGMIGNTHGARAVRMPAKNATITSGMGFYRFPSTASSEGVLYATYLDTRFPELSTFTTVVCVVTPYLRRKSWLESKSTFSMVVSCGTAPALILASSALHCGHHAAWKNSIRVP